MNIKKVVYKKLKDITKKNITDSSKIESLGLDSLDLVELITEAEDELGLSIPDEDFDKMKTVKDVIEIFEKNKKTSK